MSPLRCPRRPTCSPRGWLGVPLAALVLAACGGGGGTEADRTPSAPPSSSAGAPSGQKITLVTSSTAPAGSFKARLAGTVALSDGGCVTVAGRLVVAPPGSRVRGEEIEIPGYPVFRVGDDVVLGGGEAEPGAPGLPRTTQCGASSAQDAPHWVVAAGGPARASPSS